MSQTEIANFNISTFICDSCLNFKHEIVMDSDNSLFSSSNLQVNDSLYQKIKSFTFNGESFENKFNDDFLFTEKEVNIENIKISKDGSTIGFCIFNSLITGNFNQRNGRVLVYKQNKNIWNKVLEIDQLKKIDVNCSSIDFDISENGNQFIIGQNNGGLQGEIKLHSFQFNFALNIFEPIQTIKLNSNFGSCFNITLSGNGEYFSLGLSSNSFENENLIFKYSVISQSWEKIQELESDNILIGLARFSDISFNGSRLVVAKQGNLNSPTSVETYNLDNNIFVKEEEILISGIENSITSKNSIAISNSGNKLLWGFRKLGNSESSFDTLSGVNFYIRRNESWKLIKSFYYKNLDNNKFSNATGNYVNFSTDEKYIILNDGISSIRIFNNLNNFESINQELHCIEKIYPNPSTYNINIDLIDQCEKCDNVVIYSTIGEKVLTKTNISSSNIEIEHLSSGYYVLACIKLEKVQYVNFIKT